MNVEPTDAEIEAAARANWVCEAEPSDPTWDGLEERDRDIYRRIHRQSLAAAYAIHDPAVEARLRDQIAGAIEAGPLRQGEGATRRALAEYIRHGGEPRCGAVGGPRGRWSCVLHAGHERRHWARGDVSWGQ